MMRRILAGATLAGFGVVIARALGPKLKLHERLTARCEAMFEQMPDDFPPKRMMRGIDEIRANTARTLEFLEGREQAADESAVLAHASSTKAVGHAA